MAATLDVLVIGAGLAGLAVARDLARSGITVQIVEATNRAGGVIRTEHRAGFIVEAGPDAMLVQKPAGIELCRELGLAGEIIPTSTPRTAHVLRGGRFHALPPDTLLGLPLTDGAVARMTMLSAEGRARLTRELLLSTPPPASADESIGSFFRRRFGEEAVVALAQPLLGGIHAGDVDCLSLQALFPDLARADLAGGSVLAHLRQRRGAVDPDGAFRGLRRGMQALVDALHASVRGLVRYRHRAEAVHLASPNRVEIAGEGDCAARALVLAVPAWQAADLLARCDPDLAGLCGTISYTSTATITLAYRRADVGHPLDGMGFIVARDETATSLLAASWVSSKWPDRAPPGMAMIRAFAGGSFHADLLGLEDAALVDLAHRDLAALLDVRGAPLRADVFRWERASPQYVVGHSARVREIEARCAAHPGLFLTGSAFRGVGIPDTIVDARRTAAAAATWLRTR